MLWRKIKLGGLESKSVYALLEFFFIIFILFVYFILVKEGPTGNAYLGRETIEVWDQTLWKWDPRVGRNAQPEEIIKAKTLRLENAWNVIETVGSQGGWGHISEGNKWRGGWKGFGFVM